jgi:hypothetical protein
MGLTSFQQQLQKSFRSALWACALRMTADALLQALADFTECPELCSVPCVAATLTLGSNLAAWTFLLSHWMSFICSQSPKSGHMEGDCILLFVTRGQVARVGAGGGKWGESDASVWLCCYKVGKLKIGVFAFVRKT